MKDHSLLVKIARGKFTGEVTDVELRGLRSLVVLAETGSITRTAEKLNLSAAAIHKQLKVLEGELEVQLYEKTGRHLRLTQAATILLPHVKNLLAQYDAAVLALNEWKGLKHGLVQIGSGPSMSSYILPFLLEEFRRAFPEVELSVETGAKSYLLERLGSGALDLSFLVTADHLEEHKFKEEVSWDFEMVLVSGLEKLPRQCRLADLQKYPFILYKEGLVFHRLIERYFAEAGFHPRVIMRFDNAEAIKAMIRLGLGISMLPMWTLTAELRERSLSLVQQREPPLRAKISLVTRKLNYQPKPVERFIRVAQNWRWKNTRLTNR
ncbi:MAG: LysR family transcriptional regulator [Pyrinomonadaceae bacterium]